MNIFSCRTFLLSTVMVATMGYGNIAVGAVPQPFVGSWLERVNAQEGKSQSVSINQAHYDDPLHLVVHDNDRMLIGLGSRDAAGGQIPNVVLEIWLNVPTQWGNAPNAPPEFTFWYRGQQLEKARQVGGNVRPVDGKIHIAQYYRNHVAFERQDQVRAAALQELAYIREVIEKEFPLWYFHWKQE